MDVLRLRILARKSVHGFGYSDNKDLSVQQLLDLRKFRIMINAYFGLDRISYADDILDELCITKDLRIEKPGKLPYKEVNELVSKCMNNIYSKGTEKEKMNAFMRRKKIKRGVSTKKLYAIKRSNKKGSLMNKNHGH